MKSQTENLTVMRADSSTVFKIVGDIDHHSAKSIRNRIDSELFIARPDNVLLDLSAVDFMDSSGLGLILGRYKLATELGSSFALLDPTEAVRKIIKIAGCDRIIKTVRKKEQK